MTHTDHTELWQDIVAATSELGSDATALRIPLFINLQKLKQSFRRQVQDVAVGAHQFLSLSASTQIAPIKGGALFCFAHGSPSNMNNLLPVAREALRRGLLGGIVMAGEFHTELREFVDVVPMLSADDLIGRLGPSVRVKNAIRLGEAYCQLSRALSRRGAYLASSLASNRGAVLRELAHAVQFGSACELLLQSWAPSAMISTSDFWPFEHQLCRQSSRHGIPTLVIQHGTIGDFWWPFVADLYCMWGDTHLQQMLELGAPVDRMKVLGMPATDSMFKGARTGLLGSANKHSSPVCLILSHTHGSTVEKDVFDSFRHFIAEAIKLSPTVDWKVKLHPREDETVYREMGKSIYDRLTFHPKDISLQDAVADADVVTTVYSTAGLEAMVLGRPLIVAPATSRVQHLAPWPSMGGGTYAATASDFQMQLNHLVGDDNYRARQLEKQHSFLAKSFANQGHAAERIVDLLERYSDKQSASEVRQPLPPLNAPCREVVT
jgi:hypothetical protein